MWKEKPRKELYLVTVALIKEKYFALLVVLMAFLFHAYKNAFLSKDRNIQLGVDSMQKMCFRVVFFAIAENEK